MVINHPVKVTQGGYSDLRLWPCYMVFSGSMLLLIPRFGTFSSLIIVGTPALLFARWVAGRQARVKVKNEVHYKSNRLKIASARS